MDTQQRILIIGAGGMARDLRWIIDEINRAAPDAPPYHFVGYAVSDLERLTSTDSRDEVAGDFDWLAAHRDRYDALAMGIGTPGPRLAVLRRLHDLLPGVAWPTLIHPTARFDRKSCQVGRGVVLAAGVLGTVNLILEPFALVNQACTLGHEAQLGEGSVINPGANISGGVRVGRGVLVGTGAQVLQYLSLGEGATVGAGAVVTKDVLPGSTVVGIPARPLDENAVAES